MPRSAQNPSRSAIRPKDARTSNAMARVRQFKTAPEQKVAAALRELGAAYRRNVVSLPGKPDFANRSKGWVIQVHGCFWHQHNWKRGTLPAHNRAWWVTKFERNRARDIEVNEALRSQSLSTLTLWECETRDATRLKERLRGFLTDVAPASISTT